MRLQQAGEAALKQATGLYKRLTSGWLCVYTVRE